MRSRLRTITILTLAILVLTVAVSAVGFWKYAHYRYQGMDLAIYTNVLGNLSGAGEKENLSPLPTGRGGEGGWGNWHSSIQGGSYLGDHVEPILLLIAPLFHLWSDPRLLLILQALALGLTAVPVHLFLSSSRAERREAERSPERSIGDVSARPGFGRHDEGGRGKALFLAALWLLNPLLWNAALFEFHALSFAPLFLLSAAYCFLRRRFGGFIAWGLLSLSVREDVALIVVMFGVIGVYDWWRHWRGTAERAGDAERGSPAARRSSSSTVGVRSGRTRERQWLWILTPLLLGLAWFFLATRIAAAHSPSGAYKFLIYYGWLRDAVSHPAALLGHIVSIGNIDMTLGLLLPFLFFPLLRLRWLLLAVPPLLQILLSAPGGSSVVVETHYALLFLPGITLASVEAIIMWRAEGEHSNASNTGFECLKCRPRYSKHSDHIRSIRMFLQRCFPLPRPFAIGLGIATYLVAAWMIGPFPGIANVVIHGVSAEDRVRRAAYDELLARVPPDAPIAAGYAALPHVATRTGAYSLAYTYLGVNQYAFAPYELPDTTRYLLLDQRDAITYAVQFPEVGWSAPHAAEGPARLRKIIADGRFGIIAERDGIALLERGVATAASDGIDQRYLAPDHPVRGRLIIDSLRDIVRQINGE